MLKPIAAALDAKTLQSLIKLFGVMEDANATAVHINAEVVDVTEGMVGGDDISNVSATLDLTTGKLVLVEKTLGQPLLVWEDIGVTIHHNGRRYNLPMLEHSVPAALWPEEISKHINECGYWAVLDIRALAHYAAESEAA